MINGHRDLKGKARESREDHSGIKDSFFSLRHCENQESSLPDMEEALDGGRDEYVHFNEMMKHAGFVNVSPKNVIQKLSGRSQTDSV